MRLTCWCPCVETQRRPCAQRLSTSGLVQGGRLCGSPALKRRRGLSHGLRAGFEVHLGQAQGEEMSFPKPRAKMAKPGSITFNIQVRLSSHAMPLA